MRRPEHWKNPSTHSLCPGLCVPRSASTLQAQPSLASPFGDNMVLQRDIQIPVWGSAQGGEEIVAEMKGQKVSTRADDQGEWKLVLGPFQAGGPFEMRISASRKSS